MHDLKQLLRRVVVQEQLLSKATEAGMCTVRASLTLLSPPGTATSKARGQRLDAATCSSLAGPCRRGSRPDRRSS